MLLPVYWDETASGDVSCGTRLMGEPKKSRRTLVAVDDTEGAGRSLRELPRACWCLEIATEL